MILAIDIGKGTEDVLLYDESKNIENSIQLILPSTAKILAEKIKTMGKKCIFIIGDTMAGEPWNAEIYKKVAKYPNTVFMTPQAARSLRYNLEAVEKRGIVIVESEEQINSKNFETIELSDVDWNRIKLIISNSNISLNKIDTLLLCCQDHGEPLDPKQSTRDFRMKVIYQGLKENGLLEELLYEYNNVPSHLPRFRSLIKRASKEFPQVAKKNILIMDSSPAVTLGALDEISDSKKIIINIGNGHTLASFFTGRTIDCIYEIHTGAVNSKSLMEDLILLGQNKLTHEQALAKGAHGVFVRNKLILNENIRSIYDIYCIGPNRDKIKDLNPIYIHPGGSMMMAGPIGLIIAYNYYISKINTNKK